MDGGNQIFVALILGSIGAAYLVFGLRQRRGLALFSGIALLVLAFVPVHIALIATAALILMALPVYVKF